jgi:hypothetical protein
MRILWDLFDPIGENSTVIAGGNSITLTDNIELGATGVYQLVSQLGTNASLNTLASALASSVDTPPLFADIFEMNAAAPTNIEIGGAGGSFTAGGFQWSQSAGGVTFDVDIPLTAAGSLTFNRLGVIVLDLAGNIVRNTGFVDIGSSNLHIAIVMKPNSNKRVIVTPILDGLLPGQYQIAVYGGWDGISNSYPVSTGRYYSMFRSFSVIQ